MKNVFKLSKPEERLANYWLCKEGFGWIRKTCPEYYDQLKEVFLAGWRLRDEKPERDQRFEDLMKNGPN